MFVDVVRCVPHSEGLMKLFGTKQKVVCIGLGKTGTTSFSHAMVKLGYRHCGHGARLPQLQIPGFRSIGRKLALMHYDSFDDFPQIG